MISLLVISVVCLELFVELFRGDPHDFLSDLQTMLGAAAVLWLGVITQDVPGWLHPTPFLGALFAAIKYLTFRFGFFSPAMAYGLGKALEYLGSRADVDQILKDLNPRHLLLARAVSLLTFLTL